VLHFIYHRDADTIVKKHLDYINTDNLAHIPMHWYQFNYYSPEG